MWKFHSVHLISISSKVYINIFERNPFITPIFTKSDWVLDFVFINKYSLFLIKGLQKIWYLRSKKCLHLPIQNYTCIVHHSRKRFLFWYLKNVPLCLTARSEWPKNLIENSENIGQYLLLKLSSNLPNCWPGWPVFFYMFKLPHLLL